ncbi:MAG: family 16 glycosylhydrolase [Clostridia bacterium]|nr:family 16 glycosylhydrolase [Clostridia bacterium]
MKRIIAALISALIICSLFAGTVFATGSLEDALAVAERELYAMYTAQSGGLLRDCYDRAKAAAESGAADSGEAAALYAALDALAPLEDYVREPLLGFDGLTDAVFAAMPLLRGSVSVSEGVVTLAGDGDLRYCNAAYDGIAGPSPFGVPCPMADGFVLKICADADASLDLEIGRRGGADDCVFTLSGVYVTEGEGYYFFPFGRFGNPPLDGTLNYISLAFTGTSSVSFGDLHAASGTAEGAARAYSEKPMTSQRFSSAEYYKLLKRGTSSALTMISKPSGSDGFLTFTESVQGDDSQLWLLCADPINPNQIRLINKNHALALLRSGDSLAAACADLTDSNQVWSVSYSKAKGFSFYYPGASRVALTYTSDKPKLTETSASVKYFDVVSVGGPDYALAWSDEFNDGELDRGVWFPMTGANSDPTDPYYYRDDDNNICFEDGCLVLKTIVEDYNGFPSTAAHITTEDKLHVSYGRIEMSAKLPDGYNVWPAFWLMGDKDNWPYCGEIDIMEFIGLDEENNWYGHRRSFATFHYAGSNGEHAEIGGWTDGTMLISNEKLTDDFHIYAVEWEFDQIRWYFDDVLYLTVNIDSDALKNALQKNPMYIRLNTGIDGPGNYELPPNAPQETKYFIDYVRYYKDAAYAPRIELPFAAEKTESDSFNVIWSPANPCAVDAERGVLLYGNAAVNVMLYGADNADQAPVGKLSAGGYWVMSDAISGDGSRYVFGRYGKLTVTDSNYAGAVTGGFSGRAPVVALSFDGSRCYAGGTPQNSSSSDCDYFYIYDGGTLAEISREKTDSWVDSIAVAKNDDYAFGCYDGSVHVSAAGKSGYRVFAVDGRISALAWSPDCGTIYAATASGGVYAYDVEAETVSAFGRAGDEVYQLAVSPDGRLLAAACGDSCARIYDTASGRLAARPFLGRTAVTALAFSPGGAMLALAGTDGRIGVFRAYDGLPLALLRDRDGACWYNTVVFGADGASVIAVRGVEDFNSAVSSWTLPEGLIPESADFSALEALTYYDEISYTPESFAPYAAALKHANAVKANPYSAQSVINAAAQAVAEAAEGLVEGTLEPPVMKGDLDNDGEITVGDALIALRVAAKLVAKTAEHVLIGDVDGDGDVTVGDALKILRVAAKLADQSSLG